MGPKMSQGTISSVQDMLNEGYGIVSSSRVASSHPQHRFAHESLQHVKGKQRVSEGMSIGSSSKNSGFQTAGKSFPLTAMQRDLYLDSILHPESYRNSLGYAVEINSPLNLDLWVSIIQGLHDAQSVLRTRIVPDLDNNVVLQIFEPSTPIKFSFHDLHAEQPDTEELKSKIKGLIHIPYDIAGGDLVQYHLIALSKRRFIFVMAAHHILIDGIGFASHISTICNNYERAIQSDSMDFGSDLFPSYIESSQELFDTDNVIDFWKSKYQSASSLDVTSLINATNRNLKIERELVIDDAHWSAIKRTCRKNKITPAHYFKCLYGVLLNKYCNPAENFFINELVSGRPKGHGSAIGLYFHQIPFLFEKTTLRDSQAIADLFKYARDFQKGLGDLRYISIGQQTKLAPKAETGFMYNFINFYPTVDFLGQQERLHQVMNDVHGQVQFVPKVINGRCHLNLIYFDSEFGDLSFLERIESFSRQVVSGVEKIGDLELMLEGEREQQLEDWNNTDLTRPIVESIQSLFERQEKSTPNAEALVFEGQTLTYEQLNVKANRLAHYMVKQGVEQGDIVALCLERSVEMVVSILAVLKTGAAYVPMDPELPSDRLGYMLGDTQANLILTQEQLRGVVSAFVHTQVRPIYLDNIDAEIADQPHSNIRLKATDQREQLFNVIYTSGSTGNPKGVMIHHDGIINRVLWMQETYRLSASDRVLQKTTYGFDVSVWEFIWPLVTGATLVVAKPNGHVDAEYLVNVIREQKITTLHFVPSMLNVFLQAKNAGACESIKRVFCSGEALRANTADQFFEVLPACELHNLYGPTEASIDVSFWECKPKQSRVSVPIGKPIANIKLHILDENMKHLPVGMVGDLYIEGVGLAKGYLNLPERTEKSFILGAVSTLWEGRRLYKTGDMAKYRRDGNIDFLGRADHQVKIRGYRIETGEIENAIRQHESVAEVVVATRGQHCEDLRVVAYVVEGESTLNVHDIRAFLKSRIPSYMIPAEYFLLSEIPLTLNGKVDRNALLRCDDHLQQSASFVKPRDEVEATLAELWSAVLKVDEVSAFDGFFDLGGHSLLATQLVSRIRSRFGIVIGVQHVFEMDSLAEQAAFIRTALVALNQIEAYDSKKDSDEGNREEIEI